MNDARRQPLPDSLESPLMMDALIAGHVSAIFIER
jgi:hypothetical protein